MNNLTKLILRRKSVRRFADCSITDAQLNTLLRVAMAAPSAKNAQPWHFVVVEESETLLRLSQLLPYAKMLSSATLAIVVCGDTTIHQGEGAQNWIMDCSAATQNILLVAESLELGAVWTAAYPYSDRIDAVSSALQLPPHIMPLNVIPIGAPMGVERPLDKWKPERIHKERWNSADSAVVNDVFAESL
ncbi:MAG: nitroreductase family protein [Prevotellaceae bacterium]|jgi:nitroreductase|nr:nitroreductase family protein [Prevotellaceae bacterium]